MLYCKLKSACKIPYALQASLVLEVNSQASIIGFLIESELHIQDVKLQVEKRL